MRICREQGKYGSLGKGNIVKDELKPSTLSYEFPLVFEGVCSSDEFMVGLNNQFENFMNGIESDGCKLIGHIKMVVDAGDRGVNMGSITSFGRKVRWKGKLEAELEEVSVLLNVIVYGISNDRINKRVDESFDFTGYESH